MNYRKRGTISGVSFHKAKLGLTMIIVWMIIGLIAFSTVGVIFAYDGSSPFKHFSNLINCASPCTIVISSQGFDSGKPVVISKGTIVHWYNNDTMPHDLIGIGSWTLNTGIIKPGEMSKFTDLAVDGTYDYYCQISMARGEIQVVG